MRNTLRPGKTGMHVTGSFNLPKWVFKVYACWTERVRNSVKITLSMIVQAGIGISFIRIFTSSTCVTVQRFHWLGLGPSCFNCRAALSRNLIYIESIDEKNKRKNKILNWYNRILNCVNKF